MRLELSAKQWLRKWPFFTTADTQAQEDKDRHSLRPKAPFTIATKLSFSSLVLLLPWRWRQAIPMDVVCIAHIYPNTQGTTDIHQRANRKSQLFKALFICNHTVVTTRTTWFTTQKQHFAHKKHLRISYGSQNELWLFPYAAQTSWRSSVFWKPKKLKLIWTPRLKIWFGVFRNVQTEFLNIV
jgi:hypothetical protein